MLRYIKINFNGYIMDWIKRSGELSTKSERKANNCFNTFKAYTYKYFKPFSRIRFNDTYLRGGTTALYRNARYKFRLRNEAYSAYQYSLSESTSECKSTNPFKRLKGG